MYIRLIVDMPDNGLIQFTCKVPVKSIGYDDIDELTSDFISCF